MRISPTLSSRRAAALFRAIVPWQTVVSILTICLCLSGPSPARSASTADAPSSTSVPNSKQQFEKASERPGPPPKATRPNRDMGPGPQEKAKAKPMAPATTPAAKNMKPPGVMSKAEADRRKPRSAFLSPPGSSPGDRYDSEEPDWRDIPAWRQTSFFGIRARGQFFIYVLDGSGSMIDEDRFPRATIELRRSVFALQPPQRFEVIFYNDQAIPMPGGPVPRPADQKSKNALMHWLRTMDPEGGTSPITALSQALSLGPDAIFFLSDGLLPDETVEAVEKLNRGKIPIHCVDLAGGLAGDQLRRIARENGGSYASRPGSLHASP